MTLIEFRVSGCFGRTALKRWIDHGDDHKAADERVRHFVQAISKCLRLRLTTGLSFICLHGSPALHAAHVRLDRTELLNGLEEAHISLREAESCTRAATTARPKTERAQGQGDKS